MFNQAVSRGIRARNQAMIRDRRGARPRGSLALLSSGCHGSWSFLEAFPMSDEIKVTVASYGDRPKPDADVQRPDHRQEGGEVQRHNRPQQSHRAAAVWQDELRQRPLSGPEQVDVGRVPRAVRSREAGRDARVHTDGLSRGPRPPERIIDPDRLAKLTPQVMSQFQAEARKEGMKATTLARHLRHIKAALRWGERQGLMVKAPAIEMPKLAKGQSLAKHRPVTAEEFDRMIAGGPQGSPA